MAAGFIGLTECPWTTEHTGGDPSGAAYAPAYTVVGDDGELIPRPIFKCHHGHCADRKIVDLIDFACSRGYELQEDMTSFASVKILNDSAKSIIELADDDACICFETRSLMIFKRLQKESPADWQRLRIKLKKVKNLTITELVKTIQSEVQKGDNERSIDEHDIALSVIENVGKANLLFSHSIFWRWRDFGVWEGVDDRDIQSDIHAVMRSLYEDIAIGRTKVAGVLDIAKTECFIQDHEFNKDKERINCLTGELIHNVDEWVLEPHVREHYCTTQIPVEYNPDAEAPCFKRFLHEVFIDDEQRDEKIWLILECIGYTLTSSCRFEKFIILIGRGANGKSVFLAVLEALVGIKNIAAVQPSEFGNKFQRAHLEGKLANVVSELKTGSKIDDEALKAITSGEASTVEQKNKPPFELHPFCTCWFGTNHLPYTKDFSNALFRRAIVIPFNRVFKEQEQNRSLKDELIKELPGILNLALEAFSGVLKTGVFTHVEEVELAKAKWRTEADQVTRFVDDCCVISVTSMTPSKDLYAAYTEWAKSNGVRNTLSKNKLSSRLEETFGVELDKKYDKRSLFGIGLNEYHWWSEEEDY